MNRETRTIETAHSTPDFLELLNRNLRISFKPEANPSNPKTPEGFSISYEKIISQIPQEALNLIKEKYELSEDLIKFIISLFSAFGLINHSNINISEEYPNDLDPQVKAFYQEKDNLDSVLINISNENIRRCFDITYKALRDKFPEVNELTLEELQAAYHIENLWRMNGISNLSRINPSALPLAILSPLYVYKSAYRGNYTTVFKQGGLERFKPTNAHMKSTGLQPYKYLWFMTPEYRIEMSYHCLYTHLRIRLGQYKPIVLQISGYFAGNRYLITDIQTLYKKDEHISSLVTDLQKRLEEEHHEKVDILTLMTALLANWAQTYVKDVYILPAHLNSYAWFHSGAFLNKRRKRSMEYMYDERAGKLGANLDPESSLYKLPTPKSNETIIEQLIKTNVLPLQITHILGRLTKEIDIFKGLRKGE